LAAPLVGLRQPRAAMSARLVHVGSLTLAHPEVKGVHRFEPDFGACRTPVLECANMRVGIEGAIESRRLAVSALAASQLQAWRTVASEGL
jgi:hypothetical protein